MSSTHTARTLIPAAADAFSHRVHAVPADGWDNPTPDDEWSVRDLVAHMVEEHRWAPLLLAGQSLDDVGDRFSGDLLGDDPVGAWDAAVADSLVAFARAADDDPVELSFGPSTVDDYSEQMLSDLTVHAWDLACGARLDERLDPVLVAHVLAYVTPRVDDWRQVGLFGPRIEVDSDDPQDRLLGLMGRRP